MGGLVYYSKQIQPTWVKLTLETGTQHPQKLAFLAGNPMPTPKGLQHITANFLLLRGDQRAPQQLPNQSLLNML